MADGRWQMANQWQVASGKWRMRIIAEQGRALKALKGGRGDE
jgi:hypothetical protein